MPEIGSGLGKGIRSFRKAMKSAGTEDEGEAKGEIAEKVPTGKEEEKATEEKTT
ncbi:MAG: twin-arginine translocase TatA/TatE family subunit [Nitrospinota bacterium]